MPDLTELIASAPWREAVTYRETWPHEYVMSTRLLTKPRALGGELPPVQLF